MGVSDVQKGVAEDTETVLVSVDLKTWSPFSPGTGGLPTPCLRYETNPETGSTLRASKGQVASYRTSSPYPASSSSRS